MTAGATIRTGRDAAHEFGLEQAVAVIRNWPDQAAKSWTLDIVERAESHVEIVAIIATGSSVRDVANSDDLDLIVVYSEQCPPLPKPPISIDLRKYRQADVREKLTDGNDYLSWTLRYGKVLFERAAWWTRLNREWNNRLPMPSSDEARERARKAEELYLELRDIGDESAAAEMQLTMLTQLARAALCDARTFPKSRPEIVGQLYEIGEKDLARRLQCALDERTSATR